MNNFNSKEYWENRYRKGGNSGAGSYGLLSEYKADFVNVFIRANKIESLLEYGCGDGNNLSMIECKNVTGIDVSNTAVNMCINKMPEREFYNVSDFDFSRRFDLVTSLDVVYHLVEDDVYNEYMNNLCALSNEWLIIYSPNDDNDNYSKHVKTREFTKHESLKDFELIDIIENKYPMEEYGVIEGSFSTWYIYKRI